MMTVVIPVSYTHLDIEGASDSARYKALGNSVAIPCVDYVLRGIAWAITAQTACNLMTVSYTHLDVYKRQIIRIKSNEARK